MYIHHARNIVEGKAYADTGYIENPAAHVYGPSSYPIGFPFLLSPAVALGGLHYPTLKVVLFYKPRVLSLYTRRAADGWSSEAKHDDLWDFAERIGADYLVIKEGGGRLSENSQSETPPASAPSTRIRASGFCA